MIRERAWRGVVASAGRAKAAAATAERGEERAKADAAVATRFVEALSTRAAPDVTSTALLFTQDFGPPERVEVVGSFMHECEGEMVIKLTHAVRGGCRVTAPL